MDAITLDYVVPADDLAPYITLFYRFSADIPMFEDTERADHAQFRFRLSPGPAGYSFPDGSQQDAPPIHFLGATSGVLRTWCEGPVLVFGMGLTPAGWAAILGVDASAMTNRVLDARLLCGEVVTRAAALIAEAPTAEAMVAIAEPMIRSLVKGCDGATMRFVREVDLWLAASSSPAVEQLETATGLSRRQIERRCKALYGMAPKLLARKYRALRAAVKLAAGEPVDADGFYDQSHMIREIKQFVGLTPGQIRADKSILHHLTIAQRRDLHGIVSPIISET